MKKKYFDLYFEKSDDGYIWGCCYVEDNLNPNINNKNKDND